MADNKILKMGNFTNKVVGAVVVLVVVLLIIFVGGGKEKNETDTESNELVENNSDALGVVEPVVIGDYTYEFTGIKWDFDTTSSEVAGTDQTWLKMGFADFTRNGNAITFGSPYKLGIHPGVCKEVTFLDSVGEEGIPVAYASCEGSGVKRDFVVLQMGENVVVKMKEKNATEETGWKDWYKINVAEVVR